MEPPESAEVIETSNSKYWFEGDLLHVISKKGPEPDLETQKKQLEDFKRKLNGKKICAIMDVSEASASSKESRERNTKELPNLFKAIAFIIKNPMTRMLANLYLRALPLGFPVKMCPNEKEAREWLKEHG
jgi:hypothetical protein